MPDKIVEPPLHTAPAVFTRALLDWRPWLEPLAEESLTERHLAGLVDAARAKSPYFRLLARDPDVLEARTRPTRTSSTTRKPGCRGRARVGGGGDLALQRLHLLRLGACAAFAATYSKRADDVQRLLDEGVGADLGERWNAIVAASSR